MKKISLIIIIICIIFISIIFKNDKKNSELSFYENDINFIKEDKKGDYEKRVEYLLSLKYPKFVVEALLKEEVDRSYILRSNELVIYFNNYHITPSVEETLYLKVNYHEIKDYLNIVPVLDNHYENESGYNYTNAKKAVAITFDDSPNKNKTNEILKSLNDNHFHATFFVVGEKILSNKDLLLSIKSSGNEIGSHSYSHKNLSKLTEDEFKLDYESFLQKYHRVFLDEPKLLRPPYGLIKNGQLSLLNVSYVLWSLDTLDWRYRSSDYLVQYVLHNIKDGDIILFHDSYDSTVDAIKKLLPLLYSKGYQVMSVSELANLKNIKLNNQEIITSFN